MTLIRCEQIVWQRRHNALNPVWHLKRLNTIIAHPSQSIFLQSVRVLSVCVICQTARALKPKPPRQLSRVLRNSWRSEIVPRDQKVSLYWLPANQSRLMVKKKRFASLYLRVLHQVFSLQSYSDQLCLHLLHEWMCVWFPDACQSSNAEKKRENKKLWLRTYSIQ